MDVREIQAAIPHRYPFLLVDRVLEVDEGTIVALKNVSIGEPFFEGHFPGHPVMPGVLIVEAMAQAGAILAVRGGDFDPATQVIYFMAIDKVKFRKPVVPGDQLVMHIEILSDKGRICKLRGVATVDGQKAAEAEFMSMLVDVQKGEAK
jgi:beta-hydroxyacyl-ACP dehydratase FabZ